MNNKAIYDTYISNPNKVWNDRFVWRKDGDYPQNEISITNFVKETGLIYLRDLDNIKNSRDFYNRMSSVANEYVIWCIRKRNRYVNYKTELNNFFKGAIGEYFFTILLQNIKTFYIKQDNNVLQRYAFEYVAPMLNVYDDFGVDLTGIVYSGENNNTSYDCVFQVKFWNPDIYEPLTNSIANNAYASGVVNGYIDPNQSKNVVICWLGTDNKVSKWLKRNKNMYKHMVFIDNTVLDQCINNKMPHFWNILFESIQNIANF